MVWRRKGAREEAKRWMRRALPHSVKNALGWILKLGQWDLWMR